MPITNTILPNTGNPLPKKRRKSPPPIYVSGIKKIILHKFRQFIEKEIPIAERLTAIAGHNATGKSTLLAILANSCELKKEKPLIKSRFRGEFPDIIKASAEHDPTGSNVLEIIFSDTDDSQKEFSVPFRAAWQSYKTRFRLIPKHNGTEAKVGYPVIYLGLSRLYPLGECSNSEDTTKLSDITRYFDDHDDDKKWIIDAYKNILSQKDILDLDPRMHPDIKQKVFVGVENKLYDGLCNSSGQDNLGQILLAILSFKKLKRSLKDADVPWKGGILLIDELDATLHPAAQNRLLDLIYHESNELGFQIVFTTHSLSLLDYFYKKSTSLKYDKSAIVYVTTKNTDLSVEVNPGFSSIENDILVKDPADLSISPIVVLTEDAETRWFLNEILPEHIKRQINMPDMKRGCEELASFNAVTYPALQKSLIVLDGDFSPKRYAEYNLLILPGGSSPEGIIYNFLRDLPSKHPLLNNSLALLSHRSLDDYGPESSKYDHLEKRREKYKQWFIDNESTLSRLHVISYWKEAYKDEIGRFVEAFQQKIDSIHAMKN
ncbi:ATP-dependent nuclease [Selenomonas sp. F0473]|uniref:ATP-dependent nuclease n=1 Tax=Selenomonas sp. F0473 TaxID=999423 RepID=UPI0025E43F2A|nr:AAA family ATPase [Selenomonas sp. F0473]